MKPKTTPLAKITRPDYSGVLARTRLFKRLDQIRKKPVTWITGPPGAGKTTLVSSWLNTRKLPSIWYRVDPGDADPATFFYYMGLAAKSGRKKPLPLLTPEYLLGLPTFTRRYFEALFKRLTPPFSIVFDNYQEIPSDAPFHALIQNGLEVIPDGIRLIFISRNVPPPSFARLKVNQSIELLGWDELQLTSEESRKMIKLKLKTKGSRELSDMIDRKAQGWMAGLVLLLEKGAKGGLDQFKAVQIGTVSDYFDSEILKKMDLSAREFLLKTSFFPEMSGPMAERLTGLKEAGKILTQLNRENCFTEKRFQTDPVFRYHPLFHEFLLSRAKAQFSPEEIRQLQRKGGGILEESDRLEDAFALYRDSADWEGIIKLVMKHAGGLLKQGRSRVLEEWIRALPEEVLSISPWMLYFLGLCRFVIDPGESRNHMESAFHLFHEKKDVLGSALACSGIIDSIIINRDKFIELERWTTILAGLIPSIGETAPEEIRDRLTCSMYAGLSSNGRYTPETSVWEEKALRVLKYSSDMNIKVPIWLTYFFYSLQKGRFSDVTIGLDSLRQIAKSRESNPFFYCFLKYFEIGYYQLIIGSCEDSLRCIREGLDCANKFGIHIFDTGFLGFGAMTALNWGDFKSAGDLLKVIESRIERLRPTDLMFYYYARAHESRLKGNLREAIIQLEYLFNMMEGIGETVSIAALHWLAAQTRIELKDYEKASWHLEESRKIIPMEAHKFNHFECLLTESWCALERGDEKEGQQALQAGFSLGREMGFFNLNFWVPKMMARLCVRALEKGIEVNYVKELIKKRNIVLESPPVDLEGWPWLVRIFTLGKFSILIDDKPIAYSRKAPQTPLALLKSLTAFGGREVSEDQLTDLLWPEADGDSARKSLSVNLHRLRKLLGSEKSITLLNGVLALNPGYCHVDTWAFEHTIGKAENALKNEKREEAIQLMEKAAAIYQGPFLANDDGSLASILRERLKSKYLKQIGELGRIYEEKGNCLKAVELYKKGIEAEPLAEEFYQNLMTCYQKLGRCAEALATYARLKKILSSTFGIAPSPNTESIYTTLT